MAKPVEMIAKATLRPGQKGTKRLLEKYGDRLVCVRYRYDSVSGKRYTTVELLEAQSTWTAKDGSSKGEITNAETRKLGVRIDLLGDRAAREGESGGSHLAAAA